MYYKLLIMQTILVPEIFGRVQIKSMLNEWVSIGMRGSIAVIVLEGVLDSCGIGF